MNRKSIIVAAAAFVLAAGAYAASPYWTLKQMAAAAQERDGREFAEYVDFPSVREDVKAALQARMMVEMEREKDNNPFAAAGMALGMMMVDRMIDTIISPAGIRAMFAQARAQETASEDVKAPPSLKQAFANTEVDWNGLSEFRLVNSEDPRAAELIFERDGLGWKLVGIDFKDSLAPASQ